MKTQIQCKCGAKFIMTYWPWQKAWANELAGRWLTRHYYCIPNKDTVKNKNAHK